MLYKPYYSAQRRLPTVRTPDVILTNFNPSTPAAPPQASDPPPKYTPPPSYSTATGARIARIIRQSFRWRTTFVYHFPRSLFTLLHTKDETLGTTVRNLYCLFPYFLILWKCKIFLLREIIKTVIFKEFQVVFKGSFFVDNPVYFKTKFNLILEWNIIFNCDVLIHSCLLLWIFN